MIALSLSDVTVAFGTDVILDKISFSINEGTRLGVVGVNGAGKSLLLKTIYGINRAEDGNIFYDKTKRIAYLEQNAGFESEKILFDEMLGAFGNLCEWEERLAFLQKKMNESYPDDEHMMYVKEYTSLEEKFRNNGGYEYKNRIKSMLTALGFPPEKQMLPVSALSGGQKTRVALARTLLGEPDILMLDEPTNHLDIESCKWLEGFLGSYKKTLIVISHDRYFLDKVTTLTMEIAHEKILVSKGNYSVFQKIKAEREFSIEREYEKTMTEIKRIEGIIEQQKRFNQERNYITIASKEKQIERLKSTLVVPEKALRSVNFSFKCDIRAGDEVLFVSGLSKSFPEKQLFRNMNLNIYRDDKVFLLGPNGCGKSTFLKILNKQVKADDGLIRFGSNVKIGYFDQNIETLSSDKTVLDEVWDMYRFMTETEIRSALAMFLFRGEDVFKRVESLSGGERAKISLLKIMLAKPNFLILDEPTNHLDITSREVLENALDDFNGTLLVVSHDRYFINKLATKVVHLTHDGAVNIDGNYETYIDFRNNQKSAQTKSELHKPVINDYKLRKEQASNERKKKTLIAKTEKEITEVENEISLAQAKLSLPETTADYEKLLEVTEFINQLEVRLSDLYDKWESLQS